MDILKLRIYSVKFNCNESNTFENNIRANVTITNVNAIAFNLPKYE